MARTAAPRGHESESGQRSYALGHSDRELDRLSLQASILEPSTRRLFSEAGIRSGMRVLDLGCGSGDVSMLAAECVGDTGRVLGVDKAQPAVERAASRAAARGLSNVSFLTADLETFDPGETFDAVVGRLVLMYFRDPSQTLKRLVRFLRPGGVFAFLEYDLESARGFPDSPLFASCKRWYLAGFQATGAETRMGLRLYPTFAAAGLPAPTMRLEGVIGGGADFFGYALLAEVIRSMVPLLEKLGVATPAEIDVDTLQDRLRDECVNSNGVMVIPELIGAWSRLPQ